MKITDKLEKIENNLIKYKAETQSTADTSPLYRTVIKFDPFGTEYQTRFYKIKLLFDVENPIVEYSPSYLQPVPSGYGLALIWRNEIDLSDNTTILATQSGIFTLYITIYSSAEVKGYKTSYEQRNQ